MAHAYCYEMMKKKNASIVLYLSKFLLHLDIPMGNSSSVKELISEVEIILTEKNLLEKAPKKNMQKFLDKLKSRLEEQSGITTLETIQEATNAEASNTDVSNNSSRNDINVDNRDSGRIPTNKTDSTEENQEEAVNDCSGNKDVVSNKDSSVGEVDENRSSPVNSGKKVENKKRTRPKKARQRKDRSKATNDLLETESDALTTDSEAGLRCMKPLSKKLKVCVTRANLNALQIDKNTKSDDSSTKQNTDKDKSPSTDNTDKSTSEESLQTEENLRLTNSDSAESNRTENSDSNNRQKREKCLPDIVGRSKRRIKAKTIGKNNGGLGSQRSDNESSSDLEKEARRLSKRLKLQSLDLNKVGRVDGRRNNVLARLQKQKRAENSIDRRLPDIQNDSKTIRRTRSQNSDTRVSEDLDSDQDTILHTIIHDISQIQEMENISSFSSPNGSFGSQRSLRSNSSSILPLSKKNGSKVIDSEKTSKNDSLRRSARKVK
nr:dentin sialophosphoprotein-like [Leptinotarsa decemlineata]